MFKHKNNFIIYLVSFLILILVVKPVFSQDDPLLVFQGKVSDMSGKKILGAKIVVKKDGVVFKTESTTSNGKYGPIECNFGHEIGRAHV